MKWFTAAWLAVFCMLSADAAHAYGAVAMGTNGFGISVNARSYYDAKHESITACNKRTNYANCEALIVFENQYLVVVQQGAGRWFYGMAETLAKARSAALAACITSACTEIESQVDGSPMGISGDIYSTFTAIYNDSTISISEWFFRNRLGLACGALAVLILSLFGAVISLQLKLTKSERLNRTAPPQQSKKPAPQPAQARAQEPPPAPKAAAKTYDI